MQVLIISPTSGGIGGIAQHVQGLSDFLQKNNYKVEILSSQNTFTIPVKGLKNPSFMISAFLKTKFKKGNDIIHAHNLPSALPMKNASGKKVLTLHGIYSEQVDMLHGKITGKLSNSYEKDALTWADAITVISKEAQNYYAKLGFKVYLVPNAIDITSLPKSEERLYEKQVIFAGRLSKEKGILDVLEMSSKLPQDIHLLILGSGPEEDKVLEATKLRSNIHFLGYTQRARTISLIRGSDMLIQPSLVEAISSTLLEAMACKTPIIATNVGGNKELLENNISGVIIEPNSPQQILDGIMDLFSNKEKSTKLKEEAFRHVQKYDWSHVGKLYLDIYESLLQ
ncbi:Glycosyltransferase, group 1 [Nitrosotalea devaniterrae]|uniref:Glycosyltransferase, group 1 n=1 Tax=Nitrosotalea devaniterrae TaxID=1078905 RepID=A0A128A0U1_9ARCH|nr:Glycosyltransferase, group 1 [Candidatus Nitrosotalea devanaterra]